MDGKAIHIAEEEARENGDFLVALKLSDEATLLYQKKGNIVGLSEIQAARFEIFKHLYLQTNDRNFLILGKMSAKAGVAIAKKSEQPDALAIPLFCLAKAYVLKEKYDKAIEKFKEALEYLPQSHQNRPAVEADIKVHLAIAEFRNGDETGLERAENALSDLAGAEENKYEKDVWVSGGYMKIADAIRNANLEKAKTYLEKARTIIESNPELKLRKKQLEQLEAKLI